MISYIKKKLKEKVDDKLFNHIIGVSNTCKRLAYYYGVDPYLCEIAGLMHDYNKQDKLTYNDIKEEDKYDYLETAPAVWHGYVASYEIVDEFKFNNQDVIEAIKYHTTSKKDLCDVGKILYIADTIEPNRNFSQVEYLRLVEKDLDTHYKKVLNHCVNFLKQKEIEIGPKTQDAFDQVNEEK